MLTRPQNDAFTRASGLTIRGNFQYFSERTTMPGIRSMTGYAIAQGPCALGHVTVELRSVNSRFLDLQVRFPDELRPAEQAVRTLVTQSVAASLRYAQTSPQNSPKTAVLCRLRP